MNDIYHLETIDELNDFIKKKSINKLRILLLEEFERLVDYKNIKEWNQLVRVCEALYITNWGDNEPYEAIASKWMNGSYYTWIQNKYFEKKKGSEKGWSKQKSSFILDTKDVDKTDYYISKHSSQRNKLPKAPIRFTRSGNYQKSLQPFVDKLEAFRLLLIKETKPELYGEAFSYIGLNLCFSNHDDEYYTVRSEYFHDEKDVPEELLTQIDGMPKYYIRPRLKISNLSVKENELKLLVTRYFTKAFGYKTFEEQKTILKEDLIEIITTLNIKLKKKKVSYHTDLLKQDIERIFTLWE